MAIHPTTILVPFLALLSLYAAQKSYIAIINLQKYEERTKKAAKHLDKAAHDLYKTRVTQASGAAAVRIPTPLQHRSSSRIVEKIPFWTMNLPFTLLRLISSAPFLPSIEKSRPTSSSRPYGGEL